MIVRLIICPHCEGHIRAEFATEFSSILKWEEAELSTTPDWWQQGLTPEQIGLVDVARSSGLLDAFAQAVQKRPGGNQPRSIERFFITFLKTMLLVRVPRFALEHYVKEFGRTQTINIWSGQGVCAVVVGGGIKAFVPLDIFRGKPIRSLSGNHKSRLGGDEDTFQAWVKTRFGYVPETARLFLNEMRNRSIGEFVLPDRAGAQRSG
jgi:hypothetical protein